ncbi:MAG: hypothetical protein H0W12_00280 [Chitinophagaceae bacterium]|nr:hypothetical protein [Chitinophagaceae bacterium]
MNFQTMSKQRKYVLIAAAIGAVSVFLPWYTISVFGYSSSVSGMHDFGILVFLCFLAAGGVTLLGDQTKNLDKTFWMVALIASALAALLMVFHLFRMMDAFSYVGFGFWLSLLASIGLLYAVYRYRSPTDNFKSGFDSLKGDIESRMKSTSNTTSTTTRPPDTSSTNNNNSTTGNTNPPL